VVIKFLFILFIVCTAALVTVGLAVHFRVKRQLSQQRIDAQVRSAIEEASAVATKETKP
jgi:hypothetical protein